MIKQKMSFYEKVKRGDQPKFADLAPCDEKLSFNNECQKHHILSFPYLSHIKNNTLVLQSKVLNMGLCHALRMVFALHPTLLSHICLSSNSMSGPQTQIVLEALNSQVDLKSLII